MYTVSADKMASKMVNSPGQWEPSIAGERTNKLRPESEVRSRHYFKTNFAEQRIYCCDPQNPWKLQHTMSDAEVKNGVATEAPTAEDLKAKKRSAEVNF